MSNWRESKAIDQHGVEFDYGRQWGYLIDYKPQMDTALALRIAMDVMEGNATQWSNEEKGAALGMLAAIRAQHGVVTEDSKALGYDEDGFHATHQIDIWVFG